MNSIDDDDEEGEKPKLIFYLLGYPTSASKHTQRHRKTTQASYELRKYEPMKMHYLRYLSKHNGYSTRYGMKHEAKNEPFTFRRRKDARNC